MKDFIKLLLIFVFSYSVYGQSPSKSLYFMTSSTIANAFQNPDINFNASCFDLQIYNPTIGLFENYIYITDNQYEKSDKMFLNYTRNHYYNSIPNTILNSLSRNNSNSLNPNGASKVGEAFALGLINTFLNKNVFTFKR